MATEPFLINPYRINRRKKYFSNAPKKRKKTAVALAAPKRVSRKRRGRAKLSLGPRHRPVLYGSGSSWIRSPWSESKTKGIKLNPQRKKRSRKSSRRSFRKNVFMRNPGASLLIAGANPFKRHRRNKISKRRFRRNPALTVGGFDFIKNLPAIATGAVSAFAISAVPAAIQKFINVDLTTNPLLKYGAQIGVVAGGGYAAGKYFGTAYAYSWMLAGSAVVLNDILSTYVFKTVFPFLRGYNGYSGMGAFLPQQGLSAFPAEGNYLSGVDVYSSSSEDETTPY